VDPTAGLDDVEKREFFTIPGLNSDPSVVQPVASRYDCAIPAPTYKIIRAQADWTFILLSELTAKELRHLRRKMPPRGTTY
jgi:hypothetical protein